MRVRSWLLVAAAVLATTALLAQGRGIPNYDPKTEVKVAGTIDEVQQVPGRRNWTGTHLILKTESETLEVHAGPSSYIAGQHFSFAKGDQIEVLGSRVTLSGKPVLLAREITRDGKTLVLRDAQGIPQWSGGRRNPN
ncbi:MAG TPA: hypothetical protein VMT28_02290 [Terriglobales bacterium]|jgi:hypothetical protein|nr:hypothetical protein [Terriglobales bacterium]